MGSYTNNELKPLKPERVDGVFPKEERYESQANLPQIQRPHIIRKMAETVSC